VVSRRGILLIWLETVSLEGAGRSPVRCDDWRADTEPFEQTASGSAIIRGPGLKFADGGRHTPPRRACGLGLGVRADVDGTSGVSAGSGVLPVIPLIKEVETCVASSVGTTRHRRRHV